MSAEAPTPHRGMPPRRSRVVKSNRTADSAVFDSDPDPDGGDGVGRPGLAAQFRNAGLCRRRSQRSRGALRRPARDRAEEQFVAAAAQDRAQRRQCKGARSSSTARRPDLAILRTDAKIPPRARAVAILEHDVLLLISPAGKKIKTIAELKKKKIAVIADSESSAALVRNILELSEYPGRGGTGPDGAARLDLRQAVRIRLRRRDRGRTRLADREGQELRAIRQARRLHPERDRCGEGDRPEKPRHFRGDGGDRHAVGLARDSRGRPRHGRAGVAAGRAIQAVDHDRERSRADHLREQGRSRARRTASPPGSSRRRPTRMPSSSRIRAPPNTSTTRSNPSSNATAT